MMLERNSRAVAGTGGVENDHVALEEESPIRICKTSLYEDVPDVRIGEVIYGSISPWNLLVSKKKMTCMYVWLM
jgi:hypothetical protein